MNSYSGQIEEYLHEEDALMDFLKHQASYCDVIKYEKFDLYNVVSRTSFFCRVCLIKKIKIDQSLKSTNN